MISQSHRSTRLSHELDVGVKGKWKRGCLASHAFTSACLWVPYVIQDQMDLEVLRAFTVEATQELQKLSVAIAGQALADHHAGEHTTLQRFV